MLKAAVAALMESSGRHRQIKMNKNRLKWSNHRERKSNRKNNRRNCQVNFTVNVAMKTCKITTFFFYFNINIKYLY